MTAGRAALLGRWYQLTRETLPGMAAACRWPIHADHCFMRVCLDEAVGAPWPTVLASPAVRSMSDEQLAAAVATAERIARDPGLLVVLNDRSLKGRRTNAAGRG